MQRAVYVNVSLEEYNASRVTSYTGGSTWLRAPWNLTYVIPGAPVQIRRELETGGEVVAEVLQ